MAVERLTFEMNAVGNAVPEMKRVQDQLARVSTGMGRATSASRTYNAAQASVGRSSRGLVGGLGLVGLQIQDIAVQASMGTSALRIFSMQGPQILSIFGPVGMILGAVAGVAGGLAAAYLTAGEEASTFSERQDRLNGIMSDYQRVAEIAKMSANDLANKYGELGDEVREAANNLMTLRTIQAAAVMREQIAGLDDVVDQFGGAVFGLGTPLSEANERIREVFGARTSSQVKEIGDAFRTLGSATTFEAQTAALDEIRQITEDLGVEQLPRDLVGALVASEEFKISAAEATQILATLGDSGSSSVRRVRRELSETEKAVKGLEQSISSNMEDAFMSMVQGTKTAKDAFRDMARQIIAELYRVIVVQRTVSNIMKFLGFGGGGATDILTKAVGVRAQGGAVSAGSPYIVGEKGPEMVIPSTSGRVIPNNQLGGGGQTVNIVQNINVSTGVQQTVRTEIKQLMPQIAESAKQAVVDAKRRGGSYGRAFA